MMNFIVVWRLLKNHRSLAVLGLVLTLITLIPFIAQRISRRLAMSVRHRPLIKFQRLRVLSALAIAGSYILTYFVTELWVLYILLVVCTAFGSLAQQTLETHFSFAAFDGVLPEIEASRLLQTSIQLGASFGALLAGLLLGSTGLGIELFAIALAMWVGIWIPSLFPDFAKLRSNNAICTSPPTDTSRRGIRSLQNSISMMGSLAILGLIAIQVGAFNFLVPLIFLNAKGWSAASYGLASATAAAGAILIGYTCKFLTHSSRLLQLSIGIGYLLAHCLLVASNLLFVVCFSSLFMGAGNSLMRMVQRAFLFKHVSSKAEGSDWAARFNLVNQMGRAIAPVFFASSISYLTVDPKLMFVLTGVVVSVSIAMVLVLQDLASRSHGGDGFIRTAELPEGVPPDQVTAKFEKCLINVGAMLEALR
ncbi:hypothetical protein [Trinickia acidisoli]|uniref:hypothetical protein n=1 Tax=Trinickia acidisoli TaxID=2767482 RepID=UPI001A8D77EC|nr:hypothetical protein [Trinickia acidisoli]